MGKGGEVMSADYLIAKLLEKAGSDQTVHAKPDQNLVAAAEMLKVQVARIGQLELELEDYRRIRFMKMDAKFLFKNCKSPENQHRNIIQIYPVQGKSVATIDLNGYAITSPEWIEELEDQLAAEMALSDHLAEGIRDLYEHSHYLDRYNKAREKK